METRRVLNSCLIKEEPPDFKAQAQTREGVNQATRQLQAREQNRGVILSFLLKGEPPDTPCIIKPPPYQADVLADRPAALLVELLAELLSEVLRQMKPNKEIFFILHLDAPQSYIWKPGEHLDHIKHVPHELWYTLPHKNPRSYYLPYMEPKEINLQQLFPSLFVRLCETLETFQKLPRCHNFFPKLTRYKAHLTCLIWTHSTINVQWPYIFIYVCDLFLSLKL
uniref:Uncharacterized protein n=1 Tax=Arabidopsis halleri subsp. halleri TaxID=81971 RepID=I0J3J1_ARAHH|nr:unknown [Arabidopsis halleri subsp. halleri]